MCTPRLFSFQCTEQVGPGKGPLLGEDESSLAIYNISYLCRYLPQTLQANLTK